MKRWFREQRGQSMVEFAMVLPVLALMIFATVDFARLFLTFITVSNGAREGARQGVIYPSCSDATGNNPASIQAKIKSVTDSAVPWANVTPVITYLNASPTPMPIAAPAGGSLIRVEVSTPYEPITPLAGPIIGNPSLNTMSMMVIEQTYGCAGIPTPTPTVTATPTPTNTPDPAATPTPTATNTPAVPPTATPTFTATVCVVPNAPTLTTANHGGGSHTISWTAPGTGPAPNTYNLYGDDSNPPTTLLISGITGTSAVHGAGSHRNYAVAGVNICGTSAKSNVING